MKGVLLEFMCYGSSSIINTLWPWLGGLVGVSFYTWAGGGKKKKKQVQFPGKAHTQVTGSIPRSAYEQQLIHVFLFLPSSKKEKKERNQ